MAASENSSDLGNSSPVPRALVYLVNLETSFFRHQVAETRPDIDWRRELRKMAGDYYSDYSSLRANLLRIRTRVTDTTEMYGLSETVFLPFIRVFWVLH